LPGRSCDRQCHGPGEAAIEIATDRARRRGKWRRFACEQFLGRRRRRVRILQWRQRLGIKRAGGRRVNEVLFLRDRSARGSENEDGKQARGGALTKPLMDVCRIGGAIGDGECSAFDPKRT
jgi:hypothetical protein